MNRCSACRGSKGWDQEADDGWTDWITCRDCGGTGVGYYFNVSCPEYKGKCVQKLQG